MAAAITSPNAKKAPAEGMTKNQIRLVLERSLCRKVAAISCSLPRALDMAGNSATEIDIPKRLTGNRYNVCPYVSSANEPSGRKLARNASTNPLICTTPRLRNAGMKFRITVRTFRFALAKAKRKVGASLSTVGSCTKNCRALPITNAHETYTAKYETEDLHPKASSAIIMEIFQTIGAA